MFACMASHKSAEPNTLVLRVGFERRDELLAGDPAVYYLKDHYSNYPVVLVRLSRVGSDALADLLRIAWRLTSSTGPARGYRRRKPAGQDGPSHSGR